MIGEQFTLIAPSSNLCSVNIVGGRGPATAVNAAWEWPPSRTDSEFLLAWFARNRPEYGRPIGIRIDDADQRALAVNQLLYGGGQN
jgi:hypothetical protein